MSLQIALVGNQNSGKTTLFNLMTGHNDHVGNFPGVTVEERSAALRQHPDVTITDLPGVYSLSPFTEQELLIRDVLLHKRPDAVINIIDITNMERNLYLTLQLLEFRIPTVLAVNMMDEAHAGGLTVDLEGLADALGIPVIPIAAGKNEGVELLIEAALRVAESNDRPSKIDFCSGEVHKALHAIAHLIEDQAAAADIPLRFAAAQLIEGDEPLEQTLALSERDRTIIHTIVADMESHLETDSEAAMAAMRYDFIEQHCSPHLKKTAVAGGQTRSLRIDRILTDRIFAIPIFLLIMLFIFWLTFSAIGPACIEWIAGGVTAATAATGQFLLDIGLNPTLRSLVIDGAFAGVGAVLSFLPTIILLFFFLAILEGTGYMARVAFVFDKLMRKLGLSGRSFVPMLLGFGCSVPAIMATRTLGSERDRRLTVMLTPFMSCSAKLPVYSVFTVAFFPQHATAVMMSLYLFGIVVGIVSALLLKRTKFRGSSGPFLLELPTYRLPKARPVLMDTWDKTRDFITRAFTVIFIAAIVIWVLQSFDFRFNLVADSGQSILAAFGKLIAPVFAPLGFGDWQSSTALVTGLMSKETIISTLSILLGAGDSVSLSAALPSLFTPLSAYAFLVFTLLYMPCVATFAVTRRELGALRRAVGAAAFQTGVAWVCAFLVFQLGSLLF